jgi:hypothetical protein
MPMQKWRLEHVPVRFSEAGRATTTSGTSNAVQIGRRRKPNLDKSGSGGIVFEHIKTDCCIGVPGCVTGERLETAGRVVLPGSIFVEGKVTAGRIVAPGGIELKCTKTEGRIGVPRGAADERPGAYGEVV